MELDPQIVKQFADSVKALDSTLNDLGNLIHPPMKESHNSSSNVNFNVQGGGLGFRLVVTACLVQLVLTVCAMGFMLYVSTHQDASIAEMQVSQNRQQDYLNIILQWAPELRKKIEETRNKP